jgi:hypothetical protein
MPAPLAGPTLQLALLAMQHVSRCLDLLPTHMQPPPPPPQQQQQRPEEWLLWHLLWSARNTAEQCISWASAQCSCCAADKAALLQADFYLPVACCMLLLAVYWSLMQEELAAWRVHRAAQRVDDSGNSSSSSDSGRRCDEEGWQQAAWALACSSDNALLVAHVELLRLTGGTNKALLWASTATLSRWTPGLLHSATALLSNFAKVVADALRGEPLLLPPPLQPQQQLQLQQQGFAAWTGLANRVPFDAAAGACCGAALGLTLSPTVTGQ